MHAWHEADGVCFLCLPYIHPYIHAYIHTCIHTCIHTYLRLLYNIHTTYHPMPPMPTTTTSATTVPSSIIRRTSCWLARAELAISNSREFRMFVGGHSFIHSFTQARIQTNGGIWPLDWWTPCFGLRPKHSVWIKEYAGISTKLRKLRELRLKCAKSTRIRRVISVFVFYFWAESLSKSTTRAMPKWCL